MGRVLFAGSAVVFFLIGLVVLAITSGGDRLAAFAALAGLASMSVAVLLHVADPPRR
jgi:hypothetical protein